MPIKTVLQSLKQICVCSSVSTLAQVCGHVCTQRPEVCGHVCTRRCACLDVCSQRPEVDGGQLSPAISTLCFWSLSLDLTDSAGSSRHALLPASPSTGAIGAKHCILLLCGCCGLELSSSCLCVRRLTSEPCPQDPIFWHMVERAKRVSPNFMFEGNFSPLIHVKYVFLLYTQLVIISKVLGRRHRPGPWLTSVFSISYTIGFAIYSSFR